jgi:hypothetical protein
MTTTHLDKTNPVVVAGKRGFDLVVDQYGDLRPVPDHISTTSPIRLKSSQIYWLVRSGFGMAVADHLFAGTLPEDDAAQVKEFLQWVARASEADR